ncbi:calcitonin gene-related peptide type 1 receptor-like [Homarus americanus]|uniref:calcitonin gene-related peptide type 1 receptor-like n=1 Tax=Homarus americanus TaxID=6706 RepID=UPI001C46E742|nr:calcitonin gene-related peptide type 1 receptor-like [Homarus americanus]
MSSLNRTLDMEGHTTTLLETVIDARYQLCVQLMKSVPQPPDGVVFCPRTFDGWSCWNDTLAGNTAYSPCPYFITGFDHTRMAHKVCNEDGSWFRHPLTNNSWSNYTTCIDLDDLMMRQLINTIYIAGYSVSLIALAISLVIFFHFRTLQCTRIRLHKNLFLSFILNNILWIAWYLEVAGKPETVFENKTGCQVLHIFLHYFMVANYCWMFSEGLYLHTLLVVAFVSEERLMKWFYLLGWGAPGLIVTVYAAIRGSSSSDTKHCWIDESHYTLILSTPVCISILANLVFLINIVRVLVTKLRANHVPADTNGTRKAVRATLILIPLLGLHYVLMPFRPAPGSNGELVYQVVTALVSSFQGFCVALLFCFCNTEVTTAMKKKWQQYQFNHGSTRFSLTTACVLSVNGGNSRGSTAPHGSSVLRRTFSRGNHHHRQDMLEIPGEGSPWANTRSIVMENPSLLMETRSVVEEDYFGSREDCVGGESQHSALVEMQAVGDVRNNVVVETHNYAKVEKVVLVDPPNIVVVEPDYCSLLENGAMEDTEGGDTTAGGGRRGEGGVLNPVGDVMEGGEALELSPVKASVHQS